MGCPGGDEDSATITGSSTSYDITGLEEDSSYSITVRAINDAGSSEVTITAMTLEAGERDAIVPLVTPIFHVLCTVLCSSFCSS